MFGHKFRDRSAETTTRRGAATIGSGLHQGSYEDDASTWPIQAIRNRASTRRRGCLTHRIDTPRGRYKDGRSWQIGTAISLLHHRLRAATIETNQRLAQQNTRMASSQVVVCPADVGPRGSVEHQ